MKNWSGADRSGADGMADSDDGGKTFIRLLQWAVNLTDPCRDWSGEIHEHRRRFLFSGSNRLLRWAKQPIVNLCSCKRIVTRAISAKQQ